MPYADLLQSTLDRQVPVSAALRVLRDSGASPAEAAAALGAVTGASAEDASALVRQCGAWSVPRGSAVAAPGQPHEPVGRHGRSGHGAATVLPHLVLPYVVRPGQLALDARS